MNRHFGGKRIVCLGGLHIDRTTRFLAQPVWGRSNPVSGVRTVGGVAHNVAANLRHLDWDVLMSSALGQDADGEAALRGLQVAGIGTETVLRCNSQLYGGTRPPG